MLEDETLTEPAFAAIAEGTAAGDAWGDAIDAEIAGYEASERRLFPRPRRRSRGHPRPGAARR